MSEGNKGNTREMSHTRETKLRSCFSLINYFTRDANEELLIESDDGKTPLK